MFRPSGPQTLFARLSISTTCYIQTSILRAECQFPSLILRKRVWWVESRRPRTLHLLQLLCHGVHVSFSAGWKPRLLRHSVQTSDIDVYQSQNSTLMLGIWPAFFNLRGQILREDNPSTLGSLSDYLQGYSHKAYASAGGPYPVLASMNAYAAEILKHHPVFRSRTPHNLETLFSGTVKSISLAVPEPDNHHLNCLGGGISALGCRSRDIPQHIERAVQAGRRVSVNSKPFAIGIIAGIFSMVPCPSLESCLWD